LNELGNEFQNWGTYSVDDDFPIFGSRLKDLEDYMDHQRPGSFRQAWFATRDMSEWINRWGMVFFGVLATTAAINQGVTGGMSTKAAVETLAVTRNSTA
jgi:hypothetical protein